MSKQGSNPPPSPPGRNQRIPGRSDGGWPRWSAWIVVGILITLLIAANTFKSSDSLEISYTEFIKDVKDDKVESIDYDNSTAKIVGTRKNQEEFHTTGFSPFPDSDLAILATHDVEVTPTTPQSNFFVNLLLSLFVPLLLFVALFWWMARRQQSQMGGIMSIGRSKAKTYSSERPGTSFSDVAGYASVKKEITEVVDFLKNPSKFAEIGARIPKGVLLVGTSDTQ